jgi:type IV pilus assembly protein PilA
LPQYLGARNAAQAGAAIGELVGQTKECATFKAASGLGSQPSVGNEACTSNASQSFSRSWAATVQGIRCLGETGAGSAATITVASDGALSCALS